MRNLTHHQAFVLIRILTFKCLALTTSFWYAFSFRFFQGNWVKVTKHSSAQICVPESDTQF